MKYYFFAASLPMISMREPPPISFNAFRSRCDDQLTAADKLAVAMIAETEMSAAIPTQPAFLKQQKDIEIQIRNAVAGLRKTASPQADGEPLRHNHDGFRLDIEQAVAAAFNAATPLDRERRLDELRWRLYEELGGTDPFTSDAVLAYAARLRLSERWARLRPDSGAEQFRETIERIGTRQGNETI